PVEVVVHLVAVRVLVALHAARRARSRRCRLPGLPPALSARRGHGVGPPGHALRTHGVAARTLAGRRARLAVLRRSPAGRPPGARLRRDLPGRLHQPLGEVVVAGALELLGNALEALEVGRTLRGGPIGLRDRASEAEGERCDGREQWADEHRGFSSGQRTGTEGERNWSMTCTQRSTSNCRRASIWARSASTPASCASGLRATDS